MPEMTEQPQTQYFLVVQRSTSKYYADEQWQFAKLYLKQSFAENWVDIQLNAEKQKDTEYKILPIMLPIIFTIKDK